MGADTVLYVEGTITDEELAIADKYVSVRVDGLVWPRGDDDSVGLERRDYPSDRVQLRTGQRAYTVGYERGPWPLIYGGIRAMQGAFLGRTVYYGSDISDYGTECTDDYLASLWEHWQGPNGPHPSERS